MKQLTNSNRHRRDFSPARLGDMLCSTLPSELKKISVSVVDFTGFKSTYYNAGRCRKNREKEICQRDNDLKVGVPVIQISSSFFRLFIQNTRI